MRIVDLTVGQKAESHDVVTREVIAEFARCSGDSNPLHLDEAFASHTRFGGCVTHGILSTAYIGKVLGTRLPGPGSVYLGQTLRFKAPVHPGDAVATKVTVKEFVPDKHRGVLATICRVGETVVLEGEVAVLAA